MYCSNQKQILCALFDIDSTRYVTKWELLTPFFDIDERRLYAQSSNILGGGDGGGDGTTRSGRRRPTEFGREAVVTPPTPPPPTVRRQSGEKESDRRISTMQSRNQDPGYLQEGTVNHPDYEHVTGGVDDEFDQIWEEDEQFQAWYWELD
ncbi:hypothetical protein FRACYDRAFT_248030 [Fragilariopsis cylindrus CCMP1102]|uniref:EF-hand domain-containing protein n=1 Tax=Fragilariopsis cylindrus CCMP1102 TaxID=635003 RepID=A0A1E7EV60_9STRA|nr:hypothetical protein FRACYDRAFT_248030 [Fragilariopsis cylindrus CCMP1102]|eukprot:OEU09772.1 hypothetical protein FRACYDRAFT_248030 [Fragilariopsis cylindrus CCMP1102]